MSSPFLTIITRTYKRPGLLRRCVNSVLAQSCDDYQFVILYDEVERGIQGSFEYAASEPEPYTGRYIYMLDDDNELCDPDFVKRLRDVANEYDPDVIMVQAQHPDLGDIPRPWGIRPVGGMVDLACFVV
ncbi:MAG: glycosyltransferase, partial [Gammaproteobacteria bacterium]|nr:glycosyltransferase [Gammaproteobacteria bacterium]